jgi:hypothetical protein
VIKERMAIQFVGSHRRINKDRVLEVTRTIMSIENNPMEKSGRFFTIPDPLNSLTKVVEDVSMIGLGFLEFMYDKIGFFKLNR